MGKAGVGGRGNFTRRAEVGVTGILWLGALNVTPQEGIHLVSAWGSKVRIATPSWFLGKSKMILETIINVFKISWTHSDSTLVTPHWRLSNACAHKCVLAYMHVWTLVCVEARDWRPSRVFLGHFTPQFLKQGPFIEPYTHHFGYTSWPSESQRLPVSTGQYWDTGVCYHSWIFLLLLFLTWCGITHLEGQTEPFPLPALSLHINDKWWIRSGRKSELVSIDLFWNISACNDHSLSVIIEQ